jgi:hypothetical protein
MSQIPSLLETIDAMLACNKVPGIGGRWKELKKEEDATHADRAFLESCRDCVDNPIWSKILAAMNRYFFVFTYRCIVAEALRANRKVEGVSSGVDCFLERERKRREQHLESGHLAEALAKCLNELDEDAAAWLQDVLAPVGDLVKLHLKEAEFFRQLAGNEPEPTVPLTRQDRRGQRSGLRVRHAFIHLMAELVDWIIGSDTAVGFTRVEAIVAFARIKFPEADAEIVRKTLAPTTRTGRRQSHQARAQAQAGSKLAVQNLVPTTAPAERAARLVGDS